MVDELKEGMKRIYWSISIGLVGCTRESYFDIEADADDATIEEAAREEAFNYLDWTWWTDD